MRSWKETIQKLAADKRITSAADVLRLIPTETQEGAAYLWDRIEYYRTFGEVI